MSGVPIMVGQSQRTVVGRKWKFTTEKAVTAARQEPIMLAMCLYHHAILSVGGLRKRHTSRPERERPTSPNTIATVESSRKRGVGLVIPRTSRAALAARVIPAAVQSRAWGRWPRSGRLR